MVWMCRRVGTKGDLILGPAKSRFVLGALTATEKPSIPAGRRHALLELLLGEQASDDEESDDGREEDHKDDPFHNIARRRVPKVMRILPEIAIPILVRDNGLSGQDCGHVVGCVHDGYLPSCAPPAV